MWLLYWHWLTQKCGFVVNRMLLHQKSHNCSPLSLSHYSTFQPHTMDCQRRNERQAQSFVHQTWHQMLALYLEESRNSHYLQTVPKIFPFPKYALHSCPFHPTRTKSFLITHSKCLQPPPLMEAWSMARLLHQGKFSQQSLIWPVASTKEGI